MAVRSTFAGLNTMYRGISTNRLALDTVGHNMSNASAVGYSRQSVNQAAVMPDKIYANGTQQYIGSGVDSLSITRARDVYADKKYWAENGTQKYLTSRENNYGKVEEIFNDSQDTGVKNAVTEFYKALSDWSTNNSDVSERVAVLEKASILSERINRSGEQLQSQITSLYNDITANVAKVNEITDNIVALNKSIMALEAAGGSANDLRDARDNLADELSGYMSVSISEEKDTSMYTIVCNGATIVNGITKIDLKMGPRDDAGNVIGMHNKDYGLTDYNIELGDTGVVFDPLNGTLAAEVDAIAEDKKYIDKLADMASFLLVQFNGQHQQGAGMDANNTTGTNFFGDNKTIYTWEADANGNYRTVATAYADGLTATKYLKKDADGNYIKNADGNFEVGITVAGSGTATAEELKGILAIKALAVNPILNEVDGEKKLAGQAWVMPPSITDPTKPESETDMTLVVANGTADGTNGVLMSTLFNLGNTSLNSTTCSIGTNSFESYYNSIMTAMGVDSAACKANLQAQEDLVEEVEKWRSATSGVNWDEELTNMITFQQGYSACSRCLTTMDEMLDRLINSTGMVGR